MFTTTFGIIKKNSVYTRPILKEFHHLAALLSIVAGFISFSFAALQVFYQHFKKKK